MLQFGLHFDGSTVIGCVAFINEVSIGLTCHSTSCECGTLKLLEHSNLPCVHAALIGHSI